jgi:hypothetical protein
MTNVKMSWETHGKMDLQAIIKPNSSHYIFQWSEGGEVPKVLSGTYTSLVFMNTAVASYLARTEPQPEVNEFEKARAKTEKKEAKKKLKEEMNGTESGSSL